MWKDGKRGGGDKRPPGCKGEKTIKWFLHNLHLNIRQWIPLLGIDYTPSWRPSNRRFHTNRAVYASPIEYDRGRPDWPIHHGCRGMVGGHRVYHSSTNGKRWRFWRPPWARPDHPRIPHSDRRWCVHWWLHHPRPFGGGGRRRGDPSRERRRLR